MAKRDKVSLRCILENRLKELAGRAHCDGIFIESAADEIDRRLLAREREIAGASLELVAGGLREASAAMRQVEQGSYGDCVECSEPIGGRRLKALPWAVRCIHCQRRADRRKTGILRRLPLPLAA